jgi:hypothetical protein
VHALCVALSGCALIAGPCEIDHIEKRAACERGGIIIVVRPERTLEALGEAVNDTTRRPAGSLAHE